MRLTENEKALLIRALTCYYQNAVWTRKMVEKDNGFGSDEDYAIRCLTEKLGI